MNPRIDPRKKRNPASWWNLEQICGVRGAWPRRRDARQVVPEEPNMNKWNIKWKMGLAILFAISITAVQLGLKMYSVEESILVLLFVAAAVVAVLLLLIAFVLLQEGVRRGLLWLKARAVPIITLSDRHEAIGHPPLH